jgi:diguanylate cyclase (GGDEF)-like protein
MDGASRDGRRYLSLTETRLKILVVDDEPDVLEMLEQIFASRYDVTTACDGETAIAVLNAQPMDIVLCDLNMPKISGVEVLKEATTLRPNAVRLLVTASDRVEDVRDAINIARVNRFVSKPFRPFELVAIVESALRERALEQKVVGLVDELQEKNRLLERALSDVQDHERKLEAEVARQTVELRKSMEALRELAVRDGLTGLYNHRFFQEALTSEIARSARHNRVFSIVFLDVDHFKNYNDMLGHPAGDYLLRNLARILANTGESAEIRIRGRVSDVVARYGGEEFVIILPEAEKAGAILRADRLRAQVEDFAFEGREYQPGGKVTVSIGVSSFPVDAINKVDLIQKADDALLIAKRQGRNRVVAA